MKNTILSIILIVGSLTVKAQSLSKEFIDNKLKGTFADVEIFSNSLYIIDGNGFRPDSVDFELNRISINDFVGIDYVSAKTLSKTTMYDRKTSFILILTKNKIKKRDMRKQLKLAKNKYVKRELITKANIDTTLREPVLVVNGEKIFHSKCYTIINSIRAKDIKTIFLIGHPVSTKIWGLNAVNGLIEIRTKEK